MADGVRENLVCPIKNFIANKTRLAIELVLEIKHYRRGIELKLKFNLKSQLKRQLKKLTFKRQLKRLI